MADGRELVGLINVHRRMTAHELVRDVLRRAILSGIIPGGARLVQADIAAQLSVSTTPVREALRDLAADSLIHFDPHRGAIVRELGLEELKEIYEIRGALEPLAIRRAAERITAEQLEAARNLHQRMLGENDPQEWAQLSREFHALLDRASGSPRLISMVKTVQDAAALFAAHSLKIHPEQISEGNSEHHELIGALSAGDGDEAAAVLVRHLDQTITCVLAVASANLGRAAADFGRAARGDRTPRPGRTGRERPPASGSCHQGTGASGTS